MLLHDLTEELGEERASAAFKDRECWSLVMRDTSTAQWT